MEKFDYSKIPIGYYDEIILKKNGMRSFWHDCKFRRIFDDFPEKKEISLLDIGCFAGSFLGLIPLDKIKLAHGIDILEDQIEYANRKYGSANKKFFHTPQINKNDQPHDLLPEYDVVSIIEVIEHLDEKEIGSLISFAHSKTKQGGSLYVTTPNYLSAWPTLELLVNLFSKVKYEEQHITRFNFFTFEKKIKTIYPKFFEEFRIEFKTTSHFLAPFIAILNYKLACILSKSINHKKWKNPFGCLIIVKLVKL